MLFDPNYKFLHPDSTDNLVFLDTDTKDGIPIIRFEQTFFFFCPAGVVSFFLSSLSFLVIEVAPLPSLRRG